MTGSADEHLRRSAEHGPARCAVLTVSDTRTPQTDGSGSLIVERVETAGHRVLRRELVADEPEAIAGCIDGWLADPEVSVILITGGTGLARRDRTVEVVRRRLTVELEGFGELFRLLSFQQVGAAAMMSRAVAGLVVRAGGEGGETFVFALPGSTAAVRLALDELIVPQLKHLLWERGR